MAAKVIYVRGRKDFYFIFWNVGGYFIEIYIYLQQNQNTKWVSKSLG